MNIKILEKEEQININILHQKLIKILIKVDLIHHL